MLVKIEEAAKILGVSKSTLRNWDKNKKLIALRTPGNVRLYDTEELNKFIKEMGGIKNNDGNIYD